MIFVRDFNHLQLSPAPGRDRILNRILKTIQQSENGAADMQINFFLNKITKKNWQFENRAAKVQINACLNRILNKN